MAKKFDQKNFKKFFGQCFSKFDFRANLLRDIEVITEYTDV